MITKSPEFKGNFFNGKYFYSSAREAFFVLLSYLFSGSNKKILLPAYIGQSITEGSGIFDPIRQLKIPFYFYKINDDFSLDFDDFQNKINSADVGAAFVIHYFGFPEKSIEKVAFLCREKDVFLIEDCAHSLATFYNNVQIGDFSDAAIYSLHKFLPLKKGGMLKIKKSNTAFTKRQSFDVEVLSCLLQSSLDEIGQRRRHNYKRYLSYTGSFKNVVPFFPDLPDGVVPMNFPVKVLDKDRFEFYNELTLKGCAPVALWYQLADEIPVCDYPVSYHLSQKILNLPSHQDVSDEDIHFIAQFL